MIIFTGMDNTGKTTKIAQRAIWSDFSVVKSPGPGMTKDEMDQWILDQLKRDELEEVLYDRFLPFEEMVYGKVLRGNPAYLESDPILQTLKGAKPKIYYTRPPHETIFNFGSRDQMFGVVEESKNLLMAWDDLMWMLLNRGWRVTPYDYTRTL